MYDQNFRMGGIFRIVLNRKARGERGEFSKKTFALLKLNAVFL